MDWALTRSFLAVVREGSLAGAARALRLTHPTVRRHIEQLEEDLAASLFVRSVAGLAPTDLALALVEPAEAMEAAAGDFVRRASSKGDRIGGVVRISASEVISDHVLPGILQGLRERHPDIAVELSATDDIENLMRRDVDIAVRMARPKQSDVVAQQIGNVRLGLYAHRAWLETHGVPSSIKALVEQKAMIGYDRDPALVDALAARGVAVSRADFSFRSDSTRTQLAAARAGLGVGVVQIALMSGDTDMIRVLPRTGTELELWLAIHPGLRGIARMSETYGALRDGLTRYCKR